MVEEKSEPRFSLDEEKRKIISLLLQHVAQYHTEGEVWELYKNLNAIKFQIIDTLNRDNRLGLIKLELEIMCFKERKKMPECYEGIEIELLPKEEQGKIREIIGFNNSMKAEQKKFIDRYETRIIELLKEKGFFKKGSEEIKDLEAGA